MRRLRRVCMCVRNGLERFVIITDLGSLTNEGKHRDGPSNLPVASDLWAVCLSYNRTIPVKGERRVSVLSFPLPAPYLAGILCNSVSSAPLAFDSHTFFRYISISSLDTARSFCCPGVICLFVMIIFISCSILRVLISACCSCCYCSEFQRQETGNLSKPQL